MSKAPSTPATRLLKELKIPYTEHLYPYQEHGGTAVAATSLEVEEHAVVKTLILEDEGARPMVVLMHGDQDVSTKALARHIGCKTVQLCKPEVDHKHSGYLVGGTSPLGTRKVMPVFVETSILALERVFINGGSRGFLVGINPADLGRALRMTEVNVGL